MERIILAPAVLVVCVCSAVIGVQTDRIHSLQEEAALNTLALRTFVVTSYIQDHNRKLSAKTARRIALAGFECARFYRLDPILLFALMQQESTFNPQAVGDAGERGLMQLTRTTAGEVGLSWDDAFRIPANTCAGAAYLAQHVSDRGVERGLLRYNGGGAPEYPALVMARYQPLSNLVSQP